jgi:hypothetical protein
MKIKSKQPSSQPCIEGKGEIPLHFAIPVLEISMNALCNCCVRRVLKLPKDFSRREFLFI